MRTTAFVFFWRHKKGKYGGTKLMMCHHRGERKKETLSSPISLSVCEYIYIFTEDISCFSSWLLFRGPPGGGASRSVQGEADVSRCHSGCHFTAVVSWKSVSKTAHLCWRCNVLFLFYSPFPNERLSPSIKMQMILLIERRRGFCICEGK